MASITVSISSCMNLGYWGGEEGGEGKEGKREERRKGGREGGRNWQNLVSSDVYSSQDWAPRVLLSCFAVLYVVSFVSYVYTYPTLYITAIEWKEVMNHNSLP